MCAKMSCGMICVPAAVAMVSVSWIAARLAASWGPGGRVMMCTTAQAVAGEGIILEMVSWAARVLRESRFRELIGVLVKCLSRYASLRLAWMASFA